MPTLQEILANGGDPNAPGLLGLINRSTAGVGGAGGLGLQLLANSGYSATPRTFGQILGQSALGAQQMQAGMQEQQVKQQLLQAQLKALQAKPMGTAPIQEYEYAKAQGFPGSFADWQAQQKASTAQPAAGIQEYEYAKANGFKGSILDYQTAKQKPPEGSAEIQGYNLAKSQGYKGSYLDYLKEKAVASAAPKASFSTQASDLLAAMAAKGVALPAGMRSKEQQIATVNGLLTKFPNLSPDEIAEQIATGQIDFGAVRKETQTAAAQAGRVAIATNELQTFAPIVLQASAKVPRGSFIPINKLMQMGQESISDPNLLQLKISINSMLNAYDQLAARGGTDAAKREEAHSLLNKAQSPEALAAGVAMFQKEAAAAGEAAAKAEKYHSAGSTPAPVATAGQTKVIGGKTYVNLTGLPDGWHEQ